MRKQWKDAYKAAHEWEWRESCSAIETNKRVIGWFALKKLMNGKHRPTLDNIKDDSGQLDNDLFEHVVDAMQDEYTNDEQLDSLNWSSTIEDVERTCKHIDTGRAYGSDNIHPAFLKHGGKSLYVALHHIFSYSYRHAVIPTQWKESIIVPLYKDGDTSLAQSYRPISLTSCVMRTMEHMIQAKLILHADTVIHRHQYGFRPRHSTHNAIIHLLEDIRATARQHPKCEIPIVFLDLKKAFDRVWHTGLLHSLGTHGIRGRIWMWLRAFISQRKCCVVGSNGETSDWLNQEYGVPQGAVLSPTLFILFIDVLSRRLEQDAATAFPLTSLLLFANDGTYYPAVNEPNWRPRFQHGLDVISTWARTYRQEIHPNKDRKSVV